jgi:hypothetical protein
VSEVVSKFETGTLESTVQLIEFSVKLPNIESSCFLIDALLIKLLKSQTLLDSIQGLYLWSHVKFIVEEEPNWKHLRKEVQKLCLNALDALSEFKSKYLEQYQKFIEQQEKLSWILLPTVADFITWYCNGDLKRTRSILEAARAISCCEFSLRILSRLHAEMVRLQQINTFEALWLFNEVKRCLSCDSVQLRPEVKASFEQLEAKAPACLRLLLSQPAGQNLRLVNKFFNSSLCIQQDRVVCCNSADVCSLTVDPDTALTTFSFPSLDT